MQDANAYLDQILSEAGTKVPADSAPDVSSDVRKGDSLLKLHHILLLYLCLLTCTASAGPHY